jgi:hypothetical protein
MTGKVPLQKYFYSFALLLLATGSPLLLTNYRARERPQDSVSSKALARASLAAVLSTDCGVEMDDQWALAHLLLSPEIDLRAVITSHASSIGFSSATSAKKAAEVISYVLPPGASSRPPVMAGSDSPLQNGTSPRENAGVDFLLRLSRSFSAPRRLVIFITGAGTDVASAILKDPSFVNRISVVAMGFNDWPAGGDGFNVKNDPLAWQVILDSEVPVVVGSDAVTRRGLRLTRVEAAWTSRRISILHFGWFSEKECIDCCPNCSSRDVGCMGRSCGGLCARNGEWQRSSAPKASIGSFVFSS